MIDLKECIRYCIENFSTDEATERLFNFVNESIELKEREIELRNAINVPDVLKEPTIYYLKKTIKAIYAFDYNSCDGKYVIYVDLADLKNKERKIINRFLKKNKMYFQFVFQNKNYPCKGF